MEKWDTTHIFLNIHIILPPFYFALSFYIPIDSRFFTSHHSTLLPFPSFYSHLGHSSFFFSALHLPPPLPPLLCVSHFSFFSPFSCSTRTPGPKASGGEGDKGCGFRGPGETKMETDKRAIREKIVLLTREISLLGMQREQHRRSRYVQYIPKQYGMVYVRSLCHRLDS